MISKVRKQKPVPKPERPERPSLSEFLPQKTRNQWSLAEPNQYRQHYFLGFHERLKRIDVKLSHNPSKIPILSLEQPKIDNEEELLTTKSSMFIETLSSHNTLNTSTNYQKLSAVITPLSTTFPMVINNLDRILEVIIEKLGAVDHDCSEALLEFIIALIKDTRQQIFPAFLSKVMPKLIATLRIEDVDLLDKVFTVFSYGFKFLQRQIMDNLKNVYLCYYELLAHNNKYIRKFAAESFTYIVRVFRRLQIPWELEILLNPLFNTDQYLQLPQVNTGCDSKIITIEEFMLKVKSESNKDTTIEEILEKCYKEDIVRKNRLITVKEVNAIVIAISQLMAEVMQGTQGNPHSKAGDFLTALVTLIFDKKEIWMQVFYICRYSIILLINYLDKDKDKVIQESLVSGFKLSESFTSEIDELKLNLITILWKECSLFNKGRNISEWYTMQILKYFNELLYKDFFTNLSHLTQKNVIQCFSIIYTLKFKLCTDLYGLTNPFPERNSSNVMKQGLFKLNSPRVLYEFIRTIFATYNSLLRLNQFVGDYTVSSQALEMTIPTEKQRVLLTPLYENYVKSTFELLNNSSIDKTDIRIRLLYLLKLSKVLNEQISATKEDAANLLKHLIAHNALWKNLNSEENVPLIDEDGDLMEACLILDIISNIKQRLELDDAMLISLLKKLIAKTTEVEFTETVTEYSSKNTYMEIVHKQACENFLFLQYSESRAYFYVVILSRLIKLVAGCKDLPDSLLESVSNIVKRHRTNSYLLTSLKTLMEATLKGNKTEAFNKISLESTSDKDRHLIAMYDLLKKNLSCNLRSVRTISLEIMQNYFSDSKGLIKLLYRYENSEISLETERDKAMAIRDLKLLIASNKLDVNSVKCCVSLTFGTLWNRFAPLHSMAEDLLFSTLQSYEDNSETLFIGFLQFMQQLLHISAKWTNSTEVPYPGHSKLAIMSKDLFYDECKQIYTVNEDYIDIGMLTESLLKMFKRVVKLGPRLIESIAELFREFIEHEYNKFFPDLCGLFSEAMVDVNLTESEQLENFKRVNIKDSSEEIQAQLRRVAKKKMAGFMEVLSEAESCEKTQPDILQMLNKVAFHMLGNSDERIQQAAVRLLSKTGAEYATRNLKILEEIAQKSPSKDLFMNMLIPISDRPVLVFVIVGFTECDTTVVVWESSEEER